MITKYLFRIALSALVAFASACSCDDLVENQISGKQITMTAPDFKYADGSRTSINVTPEGGKFTWAADDTVGIFPNEGTQAAFPMINGAGTKTASFNGGGWALKPSSTYTAYYPYIKRLDFDKNAIPVSYEGQIQVGNASTEHLGIYDFMAAATKTPEQGNVTFDFEHLGALVELNFTLPKGYYSGVKLTCDENVFVTQGSVNLTSPILAIKPITTSNSLDIKLEKLQVSTEQEQVKVYFMCAPVDLTGKTIRVTLNTGGSWNRFMLPGGNWRAGRVYAMTPVLAEDLDQSRWVDLGLPSGLLWASYNVGANTPQDNGDYFAWGEIAPKESYDVSNCLTYGKKITDISSNPKYDAATANWGTPARMPTAKDLNELITNCSWTWVVGKGYSILGPNGNSIFLPAAGNRGGTSLSGTGTSVYYWSSTHSGDNVFYACYLNSNSDYFSCFSSGNREWGLPIRPVRN